MEINRDELIKQIVDKLSEGLTYDELLKSYRDDIVDSLQESTDEELIELAKSPVIRLNGEIPEFTEKDLFLMQKKIAEAVLESSNEHEVEEKVKQISPRMSLNNSKKTFENLQIMARESLLDANEKLKQLEGEENGNN
jgi:phosphopantothenate synthetase